MIHSGLLFAHHGTVSVDTNKTSLYLAAQHIHTQQVMYKDAGLVMYML